MIKLGITGNIATGKSLIEDYLQQKGIGTIDADSIVHNLLSEDKDVIKSVCDVFNAQDIKDDKGNLSRIKIGKIAFADQNKLKQLEQIIHPKVKQKIAEFFNDNKDQKAAAAIIPLLFEADMKHLFDYTITVWVDSKIQLKRLMQRNGYTEEEAMQRINAQMSQDKKIELADFSIENSGDKKEAKNQLDEILTKIL